MELERIEVADGPVNATIRVPGSKSETIRALACAGLANGRSHLYGALDSDDTRAMASVLSAFGAGVEIGEDVWAIDGGGARLHAGEIVLDVNESGLTARIAMAMAGSAEGHSSLTGSGRLPERPFGGLIDALRLLGVEIDGDAPPFRITGHGPLWGGRVRIDCSSTSQFASALMLIGPTMTERLDLEIEGLSGSHGYLDLTASTMERFGAGPERTVTGYRVGPTGYTTGDMIIEPDASSATYPLVAAAITGGTVVVEGLADSIQPDRKVAEVLAMMGCEIGTNDGDLTLQGPSQLTGVEIDMADAPDGAVALAIACLFAGSPSSITGLGSLRVKESDRLDALVEELSKFGADVSADATSLRVGSGTLTAAQVDPHGDHRMAMALALVGLVVNGVEVTNPNVVNKTWPTYWDDLRKLIE